MKKELSNLQKQKWDWEKSCQEKTAKLGEVRDKISQIKNAVEAKGRFDSEVTEFKKAEFVFLNSDQFAIGLKENDSGFQVVATLEGASANKLIEKLHEWKKPCITTEVNLTLELSELLLGQQLSADLTSEVQNLWKHHVAFPTIEGDKASFVDLDSNEYRLGYYLGHDNESFTVSTPDAKEENIRRIRTVPGTAHVGTAENLCRIEPQFKFVDCCTCEIARRLSGNAIEGERPLLLS